MITTLLCAFIAMPPAVAVERDITYWTDAAGTKLQMDVYRPVEGSKTALPTVVAIHGGAWMTGKRQDMAVICERLAQEGLAVATVSYRLAPKNKWPVMLDDVQTAVRFLRANAQKYGLRREKIGAVGVSAGGHLSLLLGARDTRDAKGLNPSESSRVQAVLNLFGPTDFRRDYGPSYDLMFNAILAKPRKDSAAEIEDASPVKHLTATMAPVFTIHGTKDALVPVAQAKWLDESLAKLNVPRVTRIVTDMGHGLDPKNADALKAYEEGIAWLRDRLK